MFLFITIDSMNQKTIIAAIGIAVVGLVGFTFFSPSQTDEAVAAVHAQTDSFVYEDYTEARFNELKGHEAFAVFVHSRTCGTCAKKHNEIIDTAGDFTNGVILKMEYSDAPQPFLEAYGVTTYETFVSFDAEGNHSTQLGESISNLRTTLNGSAAMQKDVMEDDAMMKEGGDAMEKEEVSAAPSVSQVQLAASIAETDSFRYEVFTQERYDALRGSEPFAIFFHSRTCGTCAKKNKQIIDEKDSFNGGVILKLEYSEANRDLLKELGVTTYDTFVTFDAEGNPTKKQGGSVEAVRSAIEA